MQDETETQRRLRNAENALVAYRDKENELRRALAAAVDSTRKARERVAELYEKDQQEQVALKKAEYRHCT
jgi:hypothetical protein